MNTSNKTAHITKVPIRIDLNSEKYPRALNFILGNKAPNFLYAMGNMDLFNMSGLGFCGSRKSTSKGLLTAEDCAVQAAQNDISVISGNAAGVDFEVHYNCLKNGGNTIFILPEGINNFRIKKALQSVWDWERVLVISQFEPNDTWQNFRAMARNRIIVGLSKALVVIEASDKGGTLNAGKEALKFGLPLYVAEYEDMSVNAKGNELLLSMGALKLSKSKTTNKANLKSIIDNFYQNTTPKQYLKQLSLI